jgi:hypothetical protein
MRLPWKFLLMMMFAIWGVGLAMTVNGPDKGGTNFEEGELQTSKCMVIEMLETCENINREKNFPLDAYKEAKALCKFLSQFLHTLKT